jgi:hypothetical protein
LFGRTGAQSPHLDAEEDEDDMAPERDVKRRRQVDVDRGATAADGRIEVRTWLDNPDNLRKFFDTVARASERARMREAHNKMRG